MGWLPVINVMVVWVGHGWPGCQQHGVGWSQLAWLPVINVMAMWVGGNESEIFEICT